jgi:hypothetical protein
MFCWPVLYAPLPAPLPAPHHWRDGAAQERYPFPSLPSLSPARPASSPVACEQPPAPRFFIRLSKSTVVKEACGEGPGKGPPPRYSRIRPPRTTRTALANPSAERADLANRTHPAPPPFSHQTKQSLKPCNHSSPECKKKVGNGSDTVGPSQNPRNPVAWGVMPFVWE